MQNAGVKERVQRLLEQHSQSERMLDAWWQWATNPTPPSAGYALEENCGFIATNLLVRYGQPAITLITDMAAHCRDLRRDASVFDLQQAVIEVLNGPVGQVLRDGVLTRLNQPEPSRRFLSAWLVSRARWGFRQGPNAWVAGEFDWSLGYDLDTGARDAETELAQRLFGETVKNTNLPREALAVGLVNRLLYRSATGKLEPRIRPGPRIPLGQVVYAES